MKKDYKRFVLYACSFGLNGSLMPPNPWSNVDSFGYLMAEHYGLKFVNRSYSGYNNDDMFWDICNHLASGEIQDDDLVVVQWSFTNRVHRNYEGSLMSVHAKDDKYAEWFYMHLYDHGRRITDVAVRSITLAGLIDNIVFGFAEGLTSVDTGVQTKIHRTLYEKCNLIAYNKETLPNDIILELGKDELHKCMHPTDVGHRYIADRYIKEMQILIDRGNI